MLTDALKPFKRGGKVPKRHWRNCINYYWFRSGSELKDWKQSTKAVWFETQPLQKINFCPVPLELMRFHFWRIWQNWPLRQIECLDGVMAYLYILYFGQRWAYLLLSIAGEVWSSNTHSVLFYLSLVHKHRVRREEGQMVKSELGDSKCNRGYSKSLAMNNSLTCSTPMKSPVFFKQNQFVNY